jgi:hypothetical protein
MKRRLRMKKISLTVAALGIFFFLASSAFTGVIGSDCIYKGKKLYGRVQVVTSFPDFKVKQVSSFPDLKVKKVTSFADRCGRWHFVHSFADFKIQFVDSFADFKIQYVDSFPGVK